MHRVHPEFVLRRPEPGDAEALYRYKNDPEVARQLGGFSTGMSRADIAEWIDRHRRLGDEVLWTVARREDDHCVGHVGLYRIDHRVGAAEFAILLGDEAVRGRGLGRGCTVFALRYAFRELNLSRVSLSVLADNPRALGLYESVGFRREGVLRRAQYKGGAYLDVVLMAVLREEYGDAG